ncbi:MAG: polyprenyl synthetase family protein [Bacillota bacterium]
MQTRDWLARIDAFLDECLPRPEAIPAQLHEAMRYAVFPGGKRLRPVLSLAAADAIAGKESLPKVLPLAAAVELIHSYSLVHDDLPCLDNDDWRRGRPTCHRRFGEAIALLAGDALLTLAFELVGEVPGAAAELARAAGSLGMVGGQAAELVCPVAALDDLTIIHRLKTGALFRAAVRLGGLAAGADDLAMTALTVYGDEIGLAFQIADDLLDAQQDAEHARGSYLSWMSPTEAARRARSAAERAKAAVADFGKNSQMLRAAADFAVERIS